MRLRALSLPLTAAFSGGTGGGTAGLWRSQLQRSGSKVRSSPQRGAAPQAKGGEASLLRQFPDPKGLLNNTVSRSLGVSDLSRFIQYSCTEQAGVKRATVTLLWPCRIQEDGYASKKTDAERFAAAAACLRLRDLGVIGPNNQLPRRRAGRARGGFPAAPCDHPDPFSSREEEAEQEDVSRVSEALSMFPQPKALLNRVVQAATSSNRCRELMQFTTTGGRLKRCELTLRWPEQMTLVGVAGGRVAAERRAAALACLKLKELELLDENNDPLTHAQYHRQKVKEAGDRHRQPVLLDIPADLQLCMREHLTQYPVATEVQKLWEEEELRGQQTEEDEEEEEVMDTITGRPYRPLSDLEARQLSARLQNQWERASPGLNPDLPADAHRGRLVSAVASSRAVVVVGETGCGKTTRIPRFLLEEQVKGGAGAHCNILVTQPRRISAVSVAQRVAQEMGPSLRQSVGYQVRLDSRPPAHSGGALLFLTVGVLLRKLQSNPTLTGVSHVVVDEVHERDINTDLLLALLRRCLEENGGLRVVLMSASGDTRRLAAYFGGCPVVTVPGFMHPVKQRYLEEVLSEMGAEPHKQTGTEDPNPDPDPDLDLVADVIEHIDKHGEAGAVLCFLPGWQEIRAVQDKLQAKAHFSCNPQTILPLHSSLSVADQQMVFQRPPLGRRKIVLATNIAETSITIDDVVHVVDTGTHKEQNYDPRTKVSCLDTVWISRSNVTQRRGRAGRCQPGQSYHLFPRKHLDAMTPFPIPEILRTPLESLVVQAKVHSPHCQAVDFLSQVLDSPDPKAVKDAVQNLQDIGVLDGTETLTPLGQRVACMSCDPRLGKVLVLGALFRCTLPMLSVAACLTRDPFLNSLQNRALVKKAKEALNGSSYSDYLVFSRAVLRWRTLQQGGARQSQEDFLEQYTLSRSSLRFINGLISQFSGNLCEADLVPASSDGQSLSSVYNELSDEEELLKAVLLAGLYPNLIQVKKGAVTKGRFRPNSVTLRTVGGPVLLHRSSVNRGRDEFPSRWLTFFSAVKSNDQVFIRDSSAVHPLALLLLTDCDMAETVTGDMVDVSFPGRSLMRCRLSAESWELLWGIRTAVHSMMYRTLSSPSSASRNTEQDGRLLRLLVGLLNGTHQSGLAPSADSDGEGG
ncbi:ATP-dependent RNA helicase DHX30 [Salarias fasciatus]|nr:ATP-dependent RNA helicase DHX30 [Salarias fasciatus]